MLAVLFNLGSNRYAIDSLSVTEIVPSVALTPVPHSPSFIAGQFDYRGAIVPVIDLRRLVEGGDCARLLSTRILLINYIAEDNRDHVLGLMAEKVTEVRTLNEADTVSPPVAAADAPFLGRMLSSEDGMIQLVNAEELLTQSVQDILFTTS